MKKFFTYLLICILGIVLYANFPKMISAQWDDPNYDRIPSYMLDLNSYFSSPTAIVTIDDYDNFDLGVDFAEVHISANPRIPSQHFAAWNTNGTYYTLNGIDWLRNTPTFPGGVAGDPVTAYDSLGMLYYDNMKSPITGTWVVRSSNNGLNWMTGVSANVGNDKNWISADQTGGPYANYVYGAMTPGNFVRSTDRGASFSTTFTSSNTLPGNMTCVGPWGNVQGGAVYFVKSTGSAFNAVYTFHLSTDGGATFQTMPSQNFANTVGTQVGGRNSVSNMRTRPYPFIAADNSYGPYRGRLYVVYSSNAPAGNGNKPDVFCRYSTDGAATWSNEVTVNDDPNTVNNNQWHSSSWCDKETGKLYVNWMDTRDCPTGDSALIYSTYSTDGGQTFAPNQKVSNKKFRINCTSCGGGGTPAYYGDYISIVSNSHVSMQAWTDFRNNNFGSYVGYFPDFGLRANPNNITINQSNTAEFRMVIPSVKLYTGTVQFTANITPTPANGALTAVFPNGNTLNSYPDSLLVRINAAPNTTAGNYLVTILAEGPNGTPVHRRAVALNVGLVGVGTSTQIADKYELSQNYPNPFNPTTKITYSLKNSTNVKLSVFDAMGRVVASVDKGVQEPGSHFINFNGTKLTSGVYYYKLETEFFTDTKKMLLLK